MQIECHQGVGTDKRRAAYLAQEPGETPDEEPTGERGE
jgi:hypothetical protein